MWSFFSSAFVFMMPVRMAGSRWLWRTMGTEVCV
jgi:hypothetical protein